MKTFDELWNTLKRAFDAEGIEIPFPIRTLELGQSASSVLEHRDAA